MKPTAFCDKSAGMVLEVYNVCLIIKKCRIALIVVWFAESAVQLVCFNIDDNIGNLVEKYRTYSVSSNDQLRIIL
jgi:hypothetical protein